MKKWIGLVFSNYIKSKFFGFSVWSEVTLYLGKKMMFEKN